MDIGIIGAGDQGATLAVKLVTLGHKVFIANSRGPETLAEVAERTGARPAKLTDVAVSADLVIVALPQKSIVQLSPGLFRGAGGPIIVDAGNYYPSWRDGQIEALESGMAESRWVSKQIGCDVIKAFNSISAKSLARCGRPSGAADRVALPVAGDNVDAKAVALELVDTLGFDPVDGGSLDQSWRQQPGSPAYCTDYDARDLRAALGRAEQARLPELRERAVQALASMPADPVGAGLVCLLRSL